MATGIIPRPKREMPVRGVPEKVPHDKIKIDFGAGRPALCQTFVTEAESTRTPLGCSDIARYDTIKTRYVMSNLKLRELEVVLRVS
jgi:hypothetical protein